MCVSLCRPIDHGKDCGFFIFDQGKGYLNLNDIFANCIAGVEIKNKADPILYQKNIQHGQTGGGDLQSIFNSILIILIIVI